MSHTFLTLHLVLGAVVVVEGLNFTDFCYSHARYYGGEELIDGAIWHNMTGHRSDPGIKKHYESIADFNKQNPDCCSISRYGHWSLDLIRGETFRILHRRGRSLVSRKRNSDRPGSFYDSFVSFDACGKVMNTRGILESHGPLIPAGRR